MTYSMVLLSLLLFPPMIDGMLFSGCGGVPTGIPRFPVMILSSQWPPVLPRSMLSLEGEASPFALPCHGVPGALTGLMERWDAHEEERSVSVGYVALPCCA